MQGLLPVPLPASQELYAYVLDAFLHNQAQTAAILASGEYPLLPGADGLRTSLEILLTDGVFRCAMRHVARKVAASAPVWVGEWTRGEAYTYNMGGYCTTPGAVCHGVSLHSGGADTRTTSIRLSAAPPTQPL